MDYENYDVKDHISFINFEFNLKPPIRAAAHRDCGLYYKRKGRVSSAVEQFELALEDDPVGYQSLLERSRCQLDLGRVNDAIGAAESCLATYPNDMRAQLQLNECLYEKNWFEQSYAGFSNTRYNFPKRRAVNDGPDLVKMTIDSSVGPQVGPCLLNMRGDIERYSKYKLSHVIDNRPRWKILRERGECDVVSITDALKRYVPKIEKMRNHRKRSNMHAIYMGMSTASDIQFLHSLKNDKRLYLPQTPHTNMKMKAALDEGMAVVDIYETMLWCRKPQYAKRYVKNPDAVKKVTEDALFRIQYQTRRDVFKQLVRIKELAKYDRDGLRNYVEDVISNYYSIKTKRVFPRKFEFISEIFNIVGLSYLDERTIVPNDLMQHPLKNRLAILLQIPQEKKNEEDVASSGCNSFGVKSSYVDPDMPDYAYFAYKHRVDEFEERLKRSRYPIECCYLAHELAELHMVQRKMDEPKQLAVKLVDQATESGNTAWLFLGHYTAARAELAAGQLAGCGAKLNYLADMLMDVDEFVGHFVRTALLMHENQTEADREANAAARRSDDYD